MFHHKVCGDDAEVSILVVISSIRARSETTCLNLTKTMPSISVSAMKTNTDVAVTRLIDYKENISEVLRHSSFSLLYNWDVWNVSYLLTDKVGYIWIIEVWFYILGPSGGHIKSITTYALLIMLSAHKLKHSF